MVSPGLLLTIVVARKRNRRRLESTMCNWRIVGYPETGALKSITVANRPFLPFRKPPAERARKCLICVDRFCRFVRSVKNTDCGTANKNGRQTKWIRIFHNVLPSFLKCLHDRLPVAPFHLYGEVIGTGSSCVREIYSGEWCHAFVIVSGRRRTVTVTGCDRSLSRNTMGLAIGLVRAHRTSSTRLETPILSKTR